MLPVRIEKKFMHPGIMTSRCLTFTGGSSVGKCARLSQLSRLLLRIVILTYLLTNVQSAGHILTFCFTAYENAPKCSFSIEEIELFGEGTSRLLEMRSWLLARCSSETKQRREVAIQ